MRSLTPRSSRVEPLMRTDWLRPLATSLALTSRMPLASMSKQTSIFGMPRGAGGMPSRLNSPSATLSAAIARSPWNTWTVTEVCRSAAVVKVSVFLTGTGVLRAISGVATPPSVSTPKVSGVTSTSTMSLTSPARIPAWIAAPQATHSIGSTPCSAWRPKMRSKKARTTGMRVGAPTKTMRSTWDALMPASRSACLTGWRQRSITGWTRRSSSARPRSSSRCLGSPPTTPI